VHMSYGQGGDMEMSQVGYAMFPQVRLLTNGQMVMNLGNSLSL